MERGAPAGDRMAAGAGDSRAIRRRLPPCRMQSRGSGGLLRGKGDLYISEVVGLIKVRLAPSHKGGLRRKQTDSKHHGWDKGGTRRNGGQRKKPQRWELISIVVYRTTVIWLSSHMYPGESPGRRVALSSSSDCDAVWLWPLAYEDSFNGWTGLGSK